MISVNKKSYILILRQRERAKPLQKTLLNNGLNVIIEPIFKIKPAVCSKWILYYNELHKIKLSIFKDSFKPLTAIAIAAWQIHKMSL